MLSRRDGPHSGQWQQEVKCLWLVANLVSVQSVCGLWSPVSQDTINVPPVLVITMQLVAASFCSKSFLLHVSIWTSWPLILWFSDLLTLKTGMASWCGQADSSSKPCCGTMATPFSEILQASPGTSADTLWVSPISLVKGWIEVTGWWSAAGVGVAVSLMNLAMLFWGRRCRKVALCSEVATRADGVSSLSGLAWWGVVKMESVAPMAGRLSCVVSLLATEASISFPVLIMMTEGLYSTWDSCLFMTGLQDGGCSVLLLITKERSSAWDSCLLKAGGVEDDSILLSISEELPSAWHSRIVDGCSTSLRFFFFIRTLYNAIK